MLIHGRAGIPLEVMGLMLGEVIDEYTINVIDVFAMPQSGTGVSVEAVDPVFQTTMLEMLRQVGRPQTVVGWYHSHPGFGCWLSSVDVNTQQSFEQLDSRAVAVVVDPIQSVKGKVIMDAFRLINQTNLMMGHPTRLVTSNAGFLNKPSLQALMHNLNRHYYSLSMDTKKTTLEHNVLLSMKKVSWDVALHPSTWANVDKTNMEALNKFLSLTEDYAARLDDEKDKTPIELIVSTTGKTNPKKLLEQLADDVISSNTTQILSTLVDTVIF